MKDEVLQKALTTDTSVIPRYDIVKPDGTKVAENAQLILKNSVLTEGTPLNKQNLLSDNTATSFGLDPAAAVPDDVLEVIRASVSYCPKIRINLIANSKAYVKNTGTNVTQSYTVPASGYVIVDVLAYATYSIWGELNGATTAASSLVVDTTKLYTVDVDYYACTWKFTVDAEVGARITVKHSDGLTITGTVGSDKTCSIILPKTGTYTAVGAYDSCNSSSYTFTATAATEGTTNTTAMKWITLTVNVDTGSVVTVTSGNITKGGTSASGKLKVWLPSTGTWSVTATLGGKVTSGSISTPSYATYTITLVYGVTYGVRIALSNSTPGGAAVEYTDDASGMSSGWSNWAAKDIFKDIKPCLLKAGVVQYYLNPANLTQKADGTASVIDNINTGDVMVEIPKIGYQITKDSTYLYVKITNRAGISGYNYDAFSLDASGDCSKLYIGTYLGSNTYVSGTPYLGSISGMSPAISNSLETFRNLATAKGTGYQLMSFYPLTLLQCLYLIVFKSRDGQTALGKGYTSGSASKVTGGTNALGACYGETAGTAQMCFLNIEDLWGNLSQFIEGLYVDASLNIKTAYKSFNNTGTDYPYSAPSSLDTGLSAPSYISNVIGNNLGGFILSQVSGSATTYFCDTGAIQDGYLGIFGGQYSTGTGAGPFHIRINSGGAASETTGCRIVYKLKA